MLRYLNVYKQKYELKREFSPYISLNIRIFFKN